MHQKMKPGNNPEDFKQHYDHGGSLQLHIPYVLFKDARNIPGLSLTLTSTMTLKMNKEEHYTKINRSLSGSFGAVSCGQTERQAI